MALPKRWLYRHSILVRVAHALNAVSLLALLMSGLQIFNAHPALYWGERSDFERPILSVYNAFTSDGRPVGITSILGSQFETTGVLGWSKLNRRPVPRAFPGWITIPSVQDLATGRLWHFFFAWIFVVNGLAYLGYSVTSRHFIRDLLPNRELWGRLGLTFIDLVTFRLHRRDKKAEYNILQRLSYLAVVLLLAPLVVLTGLSMSPAITAATPWLLDVFGGRQSARTIHFVATWGLVLFVLVHVAMVLLSGVFNNVRSIVTGWYSVKGEVADP